MGKWTSATLAKAFIVCALGNVVAVRDPREQSGRAPEVDLPQHRGRWENLVRLVPLFDTGFPMRKDVKQRQGAWAPRPIHSRWPSGMTARSDVYRTP